MISADKIIELMERMQLLRSQSHEYLDKDGNLKVEVALIIKMTPAEYREFSELFS